MLNLVNELKCEHDEFKEIFKMIVKEGVSREEQRLMLKEMKEKLLDHLQKEYSTLYHFLRKDAEEDTVLTAKLDYLLKNKEELTNKLIVFYGKYEGGWTDKNRLNFIVSSWEG